MTVCDAFLVTIFKRFCFQPSTLESVFKTMRFQKTLLETVFESLRFWKRSQVL